MRVLWKIIKFILKTILAIVAIAVIILLAGWIRGDDALDPNIAAFYQIDENAYTQDNGNLAMIGLVAPASVTDSYHWALQLVQAPDAYNTWETAAKNINAPSNPKVSCLYDTKWSGAKASSCLNKQDIIALLNANQLLLTRYRAALQYGHFIEIPAGSAFQGSLMIPMQQLFSASLIIRSEQEPEPALQDWIANMAFYRRALADQNSLIMHAVLLVNYGLVQEALPSLLNGHPELAQKYQDALQAVLSPFGPKDMNMALCAKAEYEYYQIVVIGYELDNYNRNKLYYSIQDWLVLWQTPYQQLDAVNESLNKKYDHIITLSDWHSPGKSVITNHVIKGMLVGNDLVKAAYKHDATDRMLNLYVQIKAKNIPPDQIAAFIANSSPALYDPFTNQPFRYDPASKTLSLALPGYGLRGLTID